MLFAAAVLASREVYAGESWRTLADGSLYEAPSKNVQDAGKVLVLLHGDGDSPSRMMRAWEPALAEGISLLAVACPRALGCSGSFWRWNGDPAFVMRSLAQAEAMRGAAFGERARALVGWSGGASYIGYRTQSFELFFPRILFHGGGIPPAQPACAEGTPGVGASIAFFVGDKNPLHYLATALRDHYTQCRMDVTFSLLPGKNHTGEWAALTKEHIAEWLAWLFPKPVAAAPVTGPTAVRAPNER